MKKQRRWMWTLVTATLVLGGFGTAVAENRLVIATASTGGTWYPLGGGIANLINQYVPDTSASAKPSGASVENIRTVGKGRVDLAIVMPDAAYSAYNGDGDFRAETKYDNLRGLFSTYPIDEYLYAVKGSGLEKLEDLKGKRVAVGAAGSGTEVLSRMILETYGMTYEDLDERFLSAPEATEALKDGTIDAALYLLGTPAPTLMDLVTQREIQFLSMGTERAKKFCEDHPTYAPVTIPAGTYAGQTEDFTTIQYYGIFIVNQDMSEQMAYDITKAVFDHLDELSKIHKAFQAIKLESATKSIAIPLHPGAEKYFREKGVL